jgi:hypothetical protein
METNTIEQNNIPEIRQTACVHAQDIRAYTPIWIGPNTIMWLCPDCADGVSEELVAHVCYAECTEALKQKN